MERCSTRSEVYTLINEFRPELLIFDTHGRFVSNETGTELQIGNEFLTGDDVIKNLPQVPLVVLSACWGAPLYGCSNTIAHAFFETGSLAVTTSLLPLEITKGAMLYTRILRNLKYASEHAMHANWASFMSHNIRTSYFDDLMSVVRKKFGMQAMAATEIHMHRRSEWQLKTMFPNTREEAYKNTLNEVLSCIDPAIAPRAKNLLNQKNYLPEFLFYTTLGRADLVSFDIWDTIKHEPLDTGPSVGAAKNALMQSPQIITTK